MIEVRDLSFRYKGAGATAVDHISFHVQPGEIFGFLGPSGAGKSTTQKILIGLLQEYSGHAHVLGTDLSALSADFYEKIGVSFEFPNHYLKLTALENLTYFSSLYRHKTLDPKHLLELVGLGQDADLRVSQFSKGMKNRLSVSRALLHDPELLFLDEPTAGLDPVNARLIRDLIRVQKENGKTIFLTTHDMAAADELCDRLAFIVEGRIDLIDSPRKLKLRYGQRNVKVEFRHSDKIVTRLFPLERLGENQEFLELIKSHELETLHTMEATLEDVFVEVTGRRLL